DFEYIIVGAGPAGLQMGYYLKTTNRKYVIIDAGEVPGSFFTQHPRHRTLISINKRFNPFPEDEYNMRHDWNSLLSDDPDLRFTRYSKKLFPNADDLVRYLADYAKKLDLNIHFNTRVQQIRRLENKDESGANFALRTSNIEYRCNILFMATGACSERIPQHIIGKEHMETYATHDVNPDKYEGKSVLVIGNGNSAFEVANHLAGSATKVHIFGDRKVKHAWDTHYVDGPKLTYVGVDDPKHTHVGEDDPKHTYVGVDDPKHTYVGVDDPKHTYVGVDDPKHSYVGVDDTKTNLCSRIRPQNINDHKTHLFGEAGKHPNDFVHIPDFETGNCHAFLNPVISYYKDGQHEDEQKLPGSLELRFDLPALDQNPAMVQNRMKNFFNNCLELEPGTEFNGSFLGSKEIFKSKVTPFTAEELQKLPDLTKYDGCIPYTIDFAD
ncbi:LOW QUALITY PROTEIN: FAD-dependent oxidoreductase domain-containing protein 2-like, partial [Saccoglossus kowalevskii]